jgi:large subunit ribosomal protein L10
VDRINKERLVKSYGQLFDKYNSVFLVKNNGLSVIDSKAIRSKFKLAGSKFLVVKNSLAKIAISKTKFSTIDELLVGPVAMACTDDPVAVAKLLVGFCKDSKNMEIIGGVMLGKQIDHDAVIDLSKLLGEKEIRAKIICVLNAAATKLVSVLRAPGNKLARVTKSYAEK